ncbi:MAG: hypothetical protein WBP12_03270 [Candidatus Saccharimonas sp.]
MADVQVTLTHEQAVWLEDLLNWRFNYYYGSNERIRVTPTDKLRADSILPMLQRATVDAERQSGRLATGVCDDES